MSEGTASPLSDEAAAETTEQQAAGEAEVARETDAGPVAGTSEPEQSAEAEETDVEVESDADRVARLEREGDVAADYLEELLDIADLDGDIDLDIEGERAIVAVVGEGLNHLVGTEGEVLEALQELTRLAVLRETGSRSRLMLDVAGHRERRRKELVTLAEKVCNEVTASGSPAKLDPMTPFERKIVHDAVAAKGLLSESEGEEPERRVVVRPA